MRRHSPAVPNRQVIRPCTAAHVIWGDTHGLRQTVRLIISAEDTIRGDTYMLWLKTSGAGHCTICRRPLVALRRHVPAVGIRNYCRLVTYNRAPFCLGNQGKAHDAFPATSMGLIPSLSLISQAAPLSFNSRTIDTSPFSAA